MAEQLTMHCTPPRQKTAATTTQANDCEFALAAAPGRDAVALAGPGVGHVYFGNEFCEHLLPTPAEFAVQLSAAISAGLAPTLATPLAADSTLRRIRQLAALLPAGAEVVCNDWGVAACLHREHAALTLVAGRQLCKSIKDPRLPSAQWLKLSPHGLAAASFVALLARLDFKRMEIDVPPFADPEFFSGLPLPLHVHADIGYAAKGRICRIGGLAVRGPRRFAAGAPCRRECLDYVTQTQRAAGSGDLDTFQSGNTMFYRHSPAMRQAVDVARERGWIRRLVLAATP
jgi:hypothetical protein